MSNESKIGLLAVITIAIAIWGFKFLKGKNILSSSTFLYAEYDNIEFLQSSSPVIINGFQVGIVSNIFMKPEDMKTIVVEIDIQNDIKLPKNTVAQIVSNGVLGEKAINLKYKGVCQGADCVQSGDYITGAKVGMIESMLGEESLDGYLDKISSSVTSVYDTISNDWSDPNSNSVISKSMQDLQASLNNMKVMTNRLNKLLASTSSQMTGMMGNMESITGNLAASNSEIKDIIGNTSSLTKKLNAVNIDETLGKVNTTIDSSGDAIEKLKATLTNADATVAELTDVLGKVNEGDGTLSMLLNDKELYGRLNDNSKNLDLLLEDFRLHPKRYIRSIFVGKKEIPYEAPDQSTGSVN